MLNRTPDMDSHPIALAIERKAIFKGVQAFINLVGDRMKMRMAAVQDESDPDVTYFMRCVGAVIVGHCEGRPMTAKKISLFTGVPHNTVARRLGKLVRAGVIVCIRGRYYLHPALAYDTTQSDDYMKIFDEIYEGIGPRLEDYRAKKKQKKRA